jgi:hypothetical protein
MMAGHPRPTQPCVASGPNSVPTHPTHQPAPSPFHTSEEAVLRQMPADNDEAQPVVPQFLEQPDSREQASRTRTGPPTTNL